MRSTTAPKRRAALLLPLLRLQRQFHRERRALAHQALDADASVVLLDDLPANAQAQAAAAVAVLVGLLRRVERLEDQAEPLLGNADAGVGDADLGHLRLRVVA